MIILGIDPSLRGTGWGIIDKTNGSKALVVHGTIKNSPKLSPSACLKVIHEQISGVIDKFQPTEVAIEGLIYVQNVQTAITMGQARGVAILAAANANLPVFEYAPKRVKQSVVGIGGASKNQVGFMIRALLGLTETPQADAADALAIALTHMNSKSSVLALKKSL